MRVAFPETKRTWCCDAFPSIDKIHRIRSIVLIIHGTDDDVIDVSHGFALYNRIHIQHQAEPLWLDGAGHNDIEVKEIFYLKQFEIRIFLFFRLSRHMVNMSKDYYD
jgi:pimeloyl-ACP methyl ester carboxylesterase